MPQQSKRKKQLQALSNEEPQSDASYEEQQPSSSQTPEERRLLKNQIENERNHTKRNNETEAEKQIRLTRERERLKAKYLGEGAEEKKIRLAAKNKNDKRARKNPSPDIPIFVDEDIGIPLIIPNNDIKQRIKNSLSSAPPPVSTISHRSFKI